ncbi:DNA polymerase III subunit beta [Deinococcus sp. 23YEL01]|uniref:DNA polymerase III subunit beta n=1 Tax=Deinococcus sp. 23YEL01 TaxID=2745871 RepID=UPI001E546952|nr:DNA polymerase III subunit beta [Deinococcus sp. 23YEL01]MCD0168020.1 DNA polymerase III subunit beta [Deinococcus sp. 23YEL01]
MIQVAKKELAAALQQAARIAGTNSKQHVAETALLLTVEPHGLTLTAHRDMHLRLRVNATPQLGMDGRKVVVPAALTAQLVTNCAANTVELAFEKDLMRISSGGSSVTVNTADEHMDHFNRQTPVGGTVIALAATDLAAAINGTVYAASTAAFQAVFRGQLITGDTDGMRIVASDGYRVAIADLPTPTPQPIKAIIHATHTRELARMIAGTSDVTLQINATHATIRTADQKLTLTMPLMDGDFPDYRRVLPDTDSSITLPAADLRESLTRVSVMADKNANNRCTITHTEDRIIVQADGDYGSGRDTIQVDDWTGEPPQIAVNSRFMLEALAVMTGTLTLHCAGSTRPFTMTSDAPGLRGVLVTLRP